MGTRDTSAKLRNEQHNLLHARLRSRRSAKKPQLGYLLPHPNPQVVLKDLEFFLYVSYTELRAQVVLH